MLSRLDGLLGAADNPADEIRKRVLITGVGKRRMKLAHFEKVGSALLHRKRLHITYYARSNNETTEREVSPQRLVYYRENWYLDGWCHLRKGVRNFSVDSIQNCSVLNAAAKEVPRKTLENVLGPGYGIFTGHEREKRLAKLRFTPERARWVASESWHPEQQGSWLEDGCYILEFPYFDDRELIMDILKFGADVSVLAPKILRSRLAEEAKRMAALYV